MFNNKIIFFLIAFLLIGITTAELEIIGNEDDRTIELKPSPTVTIANVSWNQSLADLSYFRLDGTNWFTDEWFYYNPTTYNLTFNESLLETTYYNTTEIDAFNSSWTSTYNATYHAKNSSQWIVSGDDITNRNSGNVNVSNNLDIGGNLTIGSWKIWQTSSGSLRIGGTG